MISRRTVLTALAVYTIATPLVGVAQNRRRYRVGWLSLGRSDAQSPFLDAFRQGLKERGYVEGQDIIVDVRHADGSREDADQMVAALVQSNVDVIVTQGGAVLSAVRHAGTTPVVMGYSGDPVEAKFVESLVRPGGTRTGVTFLALQLVGKRLEILAPLLPPRARIAVIADPQHPGEQTELRYSQAAANELGMNLTYFRVRSATELNSALKTIASNGTQAVVVFPDAFTLDQPDNLAAFGLEHRLPMVSGWSTYADSGFLMTYGPNLRDSYAHLATYVDKILKGAKPAELPVELPASVEFVINAKTARAIGVKPSQAMLLRADRIIE